CEAISLYLSAKTFVFVVGFDQSIVSDAILRSKLYDSLTTGREYLEKIIQITYFVAPPDDDQAARVFDYYVSRSGTASLFQQPERDLILHRSARNPRRVKRFINDFVLSYRLDQDWKTLGASNLIQLQILYVYYPEFVRALREYHGDAIAELLK